MRARSVVAVALVAMALPAGWQLRQLEVDNQLERWTGDDPARSRAYADFRDTFGGDEFVFAVLTAPEILAPEVLDRSLAAVDALERVPGVRRVQGLPVVYRDRYGGEDPEALLVEATATPFYRGLFISQDLRSLGLLIEVEIESVGDAGARRAIMAGVVEATAPLGAAGIAVDLVGSTALSTALDEISADEAKRVFPLALIGSLLALGMFLRSPRATLVAALCSALALVLTLGMAVAAGRSLNMITSALAPLLWVLAMGNIVHLLTCYLRVRAVLGVAAAVEEALARTRRPCVLAAVTTAAGFASLMVAPMQPVRELGGMAAAGIMISLAVNLSVGPTLLGWLRPAAAAGRPKRAWRWRWQAPRRPGLVVTLAVGLLVLGAALVPRVRVESNPLSFLPQDHRMAEVYRGVQGRLGGFYNLEVVLELAGPFWEAEEMSVVDGVAGRLEASPIVARVLSPLDFVRQLNYWKRGFDPAHYAVPADPAESSFMLARLDVEARATLAALATPDGRTVRLSGVVNEMDEGRFLELVAATEDALATLPPGVSGLVTGQVLQLVEAQQALVATQLRSLALAVGLTFACLGIGLTSWRLMALSLLPNVLPMVAAFALMAALGWPLDAATVVVASVALGIAVDNTAHVLEGFRRQLSAGRAARDAATAALEHVGPAMLMTAATAVVGFLSLSGSEFVPIRDFGLLAAAAMVVALIGDMILLPALLVLTERR